MKDLDPKRDFVYVGDLVQAIVRAVDAGAGFRLCNVGSGNSHSVDEVIRVVQEIQGTRLPVHSSNERRQDEIMDTVADVSMAARLLGWAPHWSFEKGLRATIAAAQASVSVGTAGRGVV